MVVKRLWNLFTSLLNRFIFECRWPVYGSIETPDITNQYQPELSSD